MKPAADTGPISQPLASADAVVDSFDVARDRDRLVSWCLERRFVIAVWMSMTVWSGALLWRSWTGYERFQYGRFDLGNMTQAVWSTAHGRFLESTNVSGQEVSRLGSHVDPILALLTPLWMLWPSPLTLIAVQVAGLALGALPVFWLARRHLGSERIAWVLAVVYLAYPWLMWTTLDAVHPKVLAIPLLLFAFWFLDSDRLVPFAVFAALAAMSGELTGITVGALGIWYAVGRRRRAGWVIAAAGWTWTAIALFVVIPGVSGAHSQYYGFYESVGGSPGGVARTVFTNPSAFVSTLTRPDDFLYLMLVGAPLAGAFLFAPGLALVAVPRLLLNAMAEGGGTTDPRQHYLSAVFPILFAATILGLARLRRERLGREVGVVLVACVLFSLVLGPWPWAFGRPPVWYQPTGPAAHVDALARAVALVPANVPVSATNKAGSHLAERRFLTVAPVLGLAHWVVLDSRDAWIAEPPTPFLVWNPARLRAFDRRLEASPQWRKVFDEDGVFVFERASGA